MPLIQFKHIVSFTSEDPAQPASNLLKSETYRKWRTAESGEKQAVVIIELQKATKINTIDIGNNGSAFVEVLVGRGSWEGNEQYKVLLVTSSFMSPAESKSFTNINRVRMFGSDKLSKPVADEKWDRVKLVCTQPFNKNEQYGLSFVSLHSPPEEVTHEGNPELNTSITSTPKRLGGFTLKDEQQDTILPGSMFLKKKTTPPPMSMAAEVRSASIADIKRETNTDKGNTGNSGWGTLGSAFKPSQSKAKEVRDKDEAQSSDDIKPVPVKHVKSFASVKKSAEVPVKRKHEDSSKRDRSDPSKTLPASRESPPQKKRKPESTKPKEEIPFNRILKGVVFVLSGFKNPERGDLRDKALQLGAQYKPDWMSGCTHLICAFPNTPKYNQVKGKGKIVSKKWITDCHRKAQKLPTKNYHLPGDTDSSSAESSDEEEVLPEKPARQAESSHGGATKMSTSASSVAAASRNSRADREHQSTRVEEEKEEMNDALGAGEETPKKEEEEDDEKSPPGIASDEDTEDELERAQQKASRNAVDDNVDDVIFDASTDNEQENNDGSDAPESDTPDELPELPDFFSHKHFLLYGEFDNMERRSLVRYITAYNGTLDDYMNDNIDFVITNETWDQNFEDALSENASLAFVRPKWIFACDAKCALVPFQPYIIVPG
ncbi:DNA repair protein XRCC1 isoform X2 [Nematostella vectensis]|uniref:DNA repair protein XRCC1 isoform X2 n=1 Tax=Nematostella vectensis TaxID=45351 RepID=UPI002076D5FE|nr:DNA repair protein XRCC1 isoform X2 [Nematostella vectensis]